MPPPHPPGSHFSTHCQLSPSNSQVSARTPSALKPPNSTNPKVDSAVVVIEPLAPPPLTDSERRVVRRVVRAAFSQRRKQLGNSLAPVAPDCRAVLAGLGIDPRRRAETLTPADFLALAREIHKEGKRGVDFEEPTN